MNFLVAVLFWIIPLLPAIPPPADLTSSLLEIAAPYSALLLGCADPESYLPTSTRATRSCLLLRSSVAARSARKAKLAATRASLAGIRVISPEVAPVTGNIPVLAYPD
jgi:hypothetical protein